MKKMLSLLLVFTLVLSMATSAFAAEGTDCGEQPQDQEDQTAPTVSTLEELQAAIAAAKDGDTIAISEEITLDAVTLETNKRIVIIRSDTYPSGTLIRLYNGAKISGFIFEEPTDSTIICVSSWETAIEIKNCQFIGNSMNTQSFINAYGGINYPNQVRIDSCYFDGATKSAIVCTNGLTLTITDSGFTDNSSLTQGGAIYSSSTLILDNCIFTGNKAVSGGGVYCSGDLTITDCQFSENQIENKTFGTDILSLGILTMTDDPRDGTGYHIMLLFAGHTLPCCYNAVPLHYVLSSFKRLQPGAGLCYTVVAHPLWVLVPGCYLSCCPGRQVCALSLAANGKAAADRFLAEPLVNILAQLIFEPLSVEPVALHRGKPCDVLSCLDDLDASTVHLLLDVIPQGFNLCSGFLGQGFPFLQGFNFADDFDSRHFLVLL